MNELVIAVAVILFPGLIAAVVTDKVAVHTRRWDSFKYSIYSFIFGVACYVMLQILSWIMGCLPAQLQFLPFIGTLDVWTLVTNGRPNIRLAEVFAATLLSAPVALLGACAINHKLFHRLAQKLRVSRKYGDENLYSYFLNANEVDWVYIRDFERKLTYQGRVVSFSENEKVQELVLSEVTVYAYDDSTEYYSVPFIYLCREVGRLVIEAVSAEMWEKADGKETVN